MGLDDDSQPPETLQQYRQSMTDLRQLLDAQSISRQKAQKKRIETELALIRMRAQVKRAEEAESLGTKKPAWTYCDPLDYFDKPRPPVDSSPSNTFKKNNLLQGMFLNPEQKPPHSEFNVKGGWNYHTSNLRNQVLAEFGNKEPYQLDEKEKMYKERLERKLARAKRLEKQDALEKTFGVYKKKKLEENAEEFSVMRKDAAHKAAWATQAVTTHEFFSSPDAYKPGEQIYESGLREHIEQPERALSFERNFIAGDGERQSFWEAPKGGVVTGTMVRACRAKALLCPRGCPELRESIMRQTRSVGDLRASHQHAKIPLVAAR